MSSGLDKKKITKIFYFLCSKAITPGGERTLLDVLEKEKAAFQKKGNLPEKTLKHEVLSFILRWQNREEPCAESIQG